MDYILEVRNVSKKYGNKLALNNFSISITKGLIYCIIGHNGAGKTTLLRIINGIIESDTGVVLFNNKIITDRHRNLIGYLPEERGLYQDMSVIDQLIYFARLKGMKKNDAINNSNHWLEKLNILEYKNKKLKLLSKGIAQKVQFIVSVIHNPYLLILDEPFSGLDTINYNDMINNILSLKKEGMTIILCTHRLEIIKKICDNIVIIKKSIKILDKNIHDLKNTTKLSKYELILQVYDNFNIKYFTNFFNIQTKIDISNNIIKCIIIFDNNADNILIKKIINFGNIIRFRKIELSLYDIMLDHLKSD